MIRLLLLLLLRYMMSPKRETRWLEAMNGPLQSRRRRPFYSLHIIKALFFFFFFFVVVVVFLPHFPRFFRQHFTIARTRESSRRRRAINWRQHFKKSAMTQLLFPGAAAAAAIHFIGEATRSIVSLLRFFIYLSPSPKAAAAAVLLGRQRFSAAATAAAFCIYRLAIAITVRLTASTFAIRKTAHLKSNETKITTMQHSSRRWMSRLAETCTTAKTLGSPTTTLHCSTLQ